MADTAAPVRTPKKKTAAKPKKPAAHPKYSEMIAQAVGSLKERGGSFRAAVLKYIMKNFNVGKDEKSVNTHLKMALRAGVKNGSLKQTKGTGASGSFRLGEKKAAAKPKKAKKPKAATTTKKPKAAAKKPKAKKSAKPKKEGAAKKAAKPNKAAAKHKKASPKKASKPKASKPKKAAAKKPAAKKPAKK